MTAFLRHYQDTCIQHRHDDIHQVIIPMTGALSLEVAGKTGTVTGQTLGFVTAQENHAFQSQDPAPFFVLDISRYQTDLETLWDHMSQAPFYRLNDTLAPLVQYGLTHIHRQSVFDWVTPWQQLFLQTLHQDLTNPHHHIPQRLQTVAHYLDQHYSAPHRNQDLATRACLSVSQFQKAFKTHYGVTPQQYLINTRITMACHLIRQGMPLAQVASKVGFTDQSAFSKSFRRITGLSPDQWRKQGPHTQE